MKEFKIKVPNEKLSKLVQERLFELGYTWGITETSARPEKQCLYGKSGGGLGWDYERDFKDHLSKEIQIADLWSDMFKENKGIENLAINGSYAVNEQILGNKINEMIDHINRGEK